MEQWLLISAGKGPEECQWLVARLAESLLCEASAQQLNARLVEQAEGKSGLLKSALLQVKGESSDGFCRALEGTVQWIGQSPFRPKHKRRNWFAGVARLPQPEEVPSLRVEDITFQTMRASGPGGQHVNKTDSAVRARHEPTGLVAEAREERSQHANKRLALIKLAALLQGQASSGQEQLQRDIWMQHQNLERGNAVRVYEGPRFKRRF